MNFVAEMPPGALYGPREGAAASRPLPVPPTPPKPRPRGHGRARSRLGPASATSLPKNGVECRIGRIRVDAPATCRGRSGTGLQVTPTSGLPETRSQATRNQRMAER